MVEKVTDNFLRVFKFLLCHYLRFKNNKSVFPGILKVMAFLSILLTMFTLCNLNI